MVTKIMRLIPLVAMSTSIIFSLEFFLSQNMLFTLTYLILELVKICVIYNNTYSLIKMQYKILIIVICIIASSFSLFAIVANTYNKLEVVKQDSVKTKKNANYDVFINKRDVLNKEIARLDNDLKNYPPLDTYRGTIPSWLADKRVEITKEWEVNKQKIIDERKLRITELNKLVEPPRTISYTVNSKKGYANIFKKLNLKNADLIFSLLFGFILELLIYASAMLAREVNRKFAPPANQLAEVNMSSANHLLTPANPLTINVSNILKNEEFAPVSREVNRKFAPPANQLADDLLTYANLVSIISANYSQDQMIVGLQKKYNLSRYAYTKYITKMKEDEIIYVKGTKIFYNKC